MLAPLEKRPALSIAPTVVTERGGREVQGNASPKHLWCGSWSRRGLESRGSRVEFATTSLFKALSAKPLLSSELAAARASSLLAEANGRTNG